ncbi:DUF6901 family protein [Reinekea marinisedimentorum]|uniref:Uncharacterized protein n=1 Tax=Reinekea marinisedimentorum TaxID=230495 RepID=A0A4R3IAE0_9GAMM|nr:hypothetical protein [Reinekea marinisedimentorum]TCS42449.1 hypothetical protein BCF53_103110 [Reinekea marinisedimentorum]
MSITYLFKFLEDGSELKIETASASEQKIERINSSPAEWTKLEYCQCSNCPLKRSEVTHCPAALDIQPIVEHFRELPGFKKVSVTVISHEREYHKTTGLEEGLRSLMGLIMANSDCPILANLKPMAFTHLPFASQDEFIIRSAGTYLLRQYFNMRDKKEADWELSGLVSLNRELQLVNQAIWQRVHSACHGDSNLKALLSFFTLSSSVSYSLQTQLNKLKSHFLNETESLELFETNITEESKWRP